MQALTEAAVSTPTPGDLVRDARKAKGLSREQLAVAAGTSMATVIRLERESKLPKVATLVSIATEVGIPPADLLPPATPGSP